MSSIKPNKNLGQHWLKDEQSLEYIVDCANITPEDTVLEIGPGLGTLTSALAKKAQKVIAVEFDELLAQKLKKSFVGSKKVEVIHSDILAFNLFKMPKNYKVVANVPYYITAKIVQLLTTASNQPNKIVLLVQKEVAERLAAKPGNLSILGVSAQYYAEVSLGRVVSAALFTPPPKVDSQVVILKMRSEKLFSDIDEQHFFKVVKAGFSAKRKKLRSSLSGSLAIDKKEAEELLKQANISPDLRAEALTLEQWAALSRIIKI
ncbi:ribosomal RNA small subunit methyltransferase A [Candidatus Saccharibacteria bacterium]|nr:ribosomal RNA small subunit methyltransferase A [Candidatus Saccharibacteria bacterium]